MCGIVGILGKTSAQPLQTVHKMTNALVHRGPDAQGYWHHENRGVYLGHRRLSVIDLSDAGRQPMRSPTGRYVVTYNGEIYNHLNIREELERSNNSPNWRGHSDTETLVHAIETWGIEKAVNKLVGMFAFAVWDGGTNTLKLVRDRMGEKPLYYGWCGNTFVFSSEIHCFNDCPEFDAKVDQAALTMLLKYSQVPAPLSIYEGVSKLLPGNILSVSLSRREPVLNPYWSLAEKYSGQPVNLDAGQAVEQLESVLREAITGQMLSDVPVGAFLSGGIDSSLIVSIMQSQSMKPVKTFSIGFREAGYDESQYAARVARQLGTDHTEVIVTPDEARTVIPKLSTIYSEPFADSSQIPTYLLSGLARKQVTVSLSGDGGDELFCGYDRFLIATRIWHCLKKVPLSVRETCTSLADLVPNYLWQAMAMPIGFIRNQKQESKVTALRLKTGGRILGSKNILQFYLQGNAHYVDTAQAVMGFQDENTPRHWNLHFNNEVDSRQQLMLLDAISYLPDDILVKLDRAAMAHSLETRVPFLDHRVVEFSLALPFHMKYRNDETKWLLRQLLDRYVPRRHWDRPKMGFGVPIGRWLRGPLSEWVEDLICPLTIEKQGHLNIKPIMEAWRVHKSGSNEYTNFLWNVLMFQSWMDRKAVR